MIFNFRLYIALILLSFSITIAAQNDISGKVVEEKSQAPVAYAAVSVVEQGLWTITDDKGLFTIPNVKSGKITLIIQCLGYTKYSAVYNDASNYPPKNLIYLKKDNLELDEVTVTAEKKENELATSYVVDKNAMNHIQSTTITDIMSQLPGAGTSTLQDLTEEQTIGIREESSSDLDNSTFGTAIEVDGIRLSNTANFKNEDDTSDGISGTAINNISTSNIESIEIVIGLPSVEYGDLTSGLVCIKTQKGRAPYEVEVIIKPKIKSYSLLKGFELKNNGGTLNASLEHTRSYSERCSPYETYVRSNLNLVYKKELKLIKKTLILTSTLAGNYGGFNTEADPDEFVDTYTKKSDNTIRAGVDFEYLLNLPWITNLEFKASVNYSNKNYKKKTNESSSSSIALKRATEEGYYMAVDYDNNPNAEVVFVLDTNGWYQTRIFDNQPIDYALSLKGIWCHNFGELQNNLKIGGTFNSSGNYGRGEYYADNRYTETSYRPYRYDEQPFINNIALYAEDKVCFPVFDRELQIQGGIRNDITFINGSRYGTVSSLSPRANIKYKILKGNKGVIKNMCVHAGFGDAVKLPSSNILYPRPKYVDKKVFETPSYGDNISYPAYYTFAVEAVYNPNLKYQRVRKTEVGIDIKTKIAKFSLTAYYDKTFNPYKLSKVYTPYSFTYTDETALDDCTIPEDDREFNIDKETGIITVSDITGTCADQELAYTTKNRYLSNNFYTNGSSDIVKKGLEWIVRFKKIPALNTSVRIDGNYSYYKGVDESLQVNLPNSTATASDGELYDYLAYYIGSTTVANGRITQKIKNNVTFTTHIPRLRLIMTLRIESCLFNYTQDLCEYSEGERGFVIDEKTDYIASETNTDIYAGDQYVAMYPLYYSTWDDPNTKIPFKEKFLWAKENDEDLYDDLAKMVKKSTKIYDFNSEKLSPYFSANLNITKEIGDKVSLSFLANNFINNMGKIKNSQTNTYVSLYGNSRIPALYYGLTLRVKL